MLERGVGHSFEFQFEFSLDWVPDGGLAAQLCQVVLFPVPLEERKETPCVLAAVEARNVAVVDIVRLKLYVLTMKIHSNVQSRRFIAFQDEASPPPPKPQLSSVLMSSSKALADTMISRSECRPAGTSGMAPIS
jgi:hypothetical protein